MPNYNEQSINSTSYQRAKTIFINNEYGNDPSILFNEEIIVELSNNTAAHQDVGQLHGMLSTSNQSEQVYIVDPITGLPTTTSMTYSEITNVIKSLYLHLAVKRDESLAQLEAAKQDTIASINLTVTNALAEAINTKDLAYTALQNTNIAVNNDDYDTSVLHSNDAQIYATQSNQQAIITEQAIASSIYASNEAKANSTLARQAATTAQQYATDALSSANTILPVN